MPRSSRLLLLGGAAAAPLFLTLWAIQAFTRDGFRPTFHPMSLLSLGDGGWVQIMNFVVTGLLVIGAGIGLSGVWRASRLARWATALIGVMGVGLVISGVFVTDAGAGFPAGSPEGAPTMSWHGAVHEGGFLLTQVAFLAAGILFAVFFARARRGGWATVCIVAMSAAILVAALGEVEALAIRLVISAVIELALIGVLSVEGIRQMGADRGPARVAYDELHGSPSAA